MPPLVEYSESDESDSVETTVTLKQSTKRKRSGSQSFEDVGVNAALPVLPESFHDLYASTVRRGTEDDPALHGGRRRQNPHVEGHWPTHVYIDCKFSMPTTSIQSVPAR